MDRMNTCLLVCWLSITIIVILVLKPATQEAFEQKYQTTYALPQIGFVPDSPWAKFSQGMRLNPPPPPSIYSPGLNPWYNWQANMSSQCSANDAPFAPRTQQDCPDSSYTYVTDMSQFVPNVQGGGCIQLGIGSQNFCYSNEQGKYQPWWEKINVQTP